MLNKIDSMPIVEVVKAFGENAGGQSCRGGGDGKWRK